jgi:hypothetical protein
MCRAGPATPGTYRPREAGGRACRARAGRGGRARYRRLGRGRSAAAARDRRGRRPPRSNPACDWHRRLLGDPARQDRRGADEELRNRLELPVLVENDANLGALVEAAYGAGREAVNLAFLTKTAFGRYIRAVGGNAEAAHRAGIPVARVRTIVFVLASTLTAAGGMLAASRLLAVNQGSGSGHLLLLAIAGPVIAGVSLFAGGGTVWAALLGAS